MPRGKNSKTASKTAAEPIKEAAAPEKKSVKATADKKKSATAKTATTKSASAKTTAKSATKIVAKKTATSAKASKTNAKKAATAAKTEKKTAAKPKTSASSATAKAAPKKSTARKTAKAKSDEIIIQSGEKEYTMSEIAQLCKDAYRGGTRKQVKSIKVYVKAEKNKLKAYYIVNDSVNGSVDL